MTDGKRETINLPDGRASRFKYQATSRKEMCLMWMWRVTSTRRTRAAQADDDTPRRAREFFRDGIAMMQSETRQL